MKLDGKDELEAVYYTQNGIEVVIPYKSKKFSAKYPEIRQT